MQSMLKVSVDDGSPDNGPCNNCSFFLYSVVWSLEDFSTVVLATLD